MICKNCVYWYIYVVKDVGYCSLFKIPTEYWENCSDWKLSGEAKQNQNDEGDEYE